MKRRTHRPAEPAARTPRAPSDGNAAATQSGVMYGRLLQAARLATIGEMAAGVGHELNQLAVLDNGPGVLPQALAQIFDPFFSTKSAGAGLGLAISNTVVRAHGGSLMYHPNTPAGACFAIRIRAES